MNHVGLMRSNGRDARPPAARDDRAPVAVWTNACVRQCPLGQPFTTLHVPINLQHGLLALSPGRGAPHGDVTSVQLHSGAWGTAKQASQYWFSSGCESSPRDVCALGTAVTAHELSPRPPTACPLSLRPSRRVAIDFGSCRGACEVARGGPGTLTRRPRIGLVHHGSNLWRAAAVPHVYPQMHSVHSMSSEEYLGCHGTGADSIAPIRWTTGPARRPGPPAGPASEAGASTHTPPPPHNEWRPHLAGLAGPRVAREHGAAAAWFRPLGWSRGTLVCCIPRPPQDGPGVAPHARGPRDMRR